jgi:rhodanese-related sulfurtransferase
MNRTAFVTSVLLALLGAPLPAQVTTTRNEGAFRMSVEAAPKPAYPPALLAKNVTGVAVAAVLIGPDGTPDAVVVLEAPDPLMAEAVQTAVRQWKFPPATARPEQGADPIRVSSKLTFYFHVRNGAGVVLNPDEMPNGPRWIPAPPGGPPAAPPGARMGRPAVRMGGHDISGLEIDQAEFERRAASRSTVIVDPRDRDAFRRGHMPGALNMPSDEVPVRARIEIPADKAVVVDCSQAEDFTCMIGATLLAEAGFRVSVFRG